MSTDTVQSISQGTIQAGGGAAIIAWGFNLGEILAIGGFVVALTGLVFSIWFNFKYRRNDE